MTMRRLFAAVLAAVIVTGVLPSATLGAELKPAITISTPKIAVRKDRFMPLSGVITRTHVTASDRVLLRLYRLEGGEWKLKTTLKPARTRQNWTTTRWSASIKPAMRGQWRARVVVAAADGRFPTGASTWVRWRIVSPKYVALTFDDGSWTSTTDRIRSSLDAAGVKATFFMLGQHTRTYPAPAKRVAASKHQIAVHTMSHPMLTGLSDAGIRKQLGDCRSVLQSITGQRATWYRPPGGATSARVRRVASSIGLREMLWTVDTRDWTGPSSSTIRSRAVNGTRPGGVVLMHDGGGNRSSTAAAVPGIVKDLKAKGYDFVTLNEWAALR